MFDSVKGLIDEHKAVQEELSDPAVHADAARAKRVNRRYAELSKIVAAHDAWAAASDDLEAARELAKEDDAFADEVPALEEHLALAQEKLRRLLIPRDPDDARDVIMEIKGGEGGAESALFAADLLRMYLQYAASKGWKTELLERTESDLGGYKDVQVAIKGSSSDPAQGVWAHLKYEGGVHRVQRVPATESQGRIHTSTTGVLVFPEVDEPDEVEINPNDLKIDVFRSIGSRRSVGEHHRLRRAHHPPSDRHRRLDAEREVAAAEPRGGHAGAPGAYPRQAAGRAGCRGLRRASLADPRHGPLRAHPHVQLPREPHRRPPHGVQGLQPRPGHGRSTRADHRVGHPGRRRSAARRPRHRLLTTEGGASLARAPWALA